MDELKNLRGSDYYIFNVDENNKTEIININKRRGLPPNVPNDPNSPFSVNDKNVKLWMSSFITPGTLVEKQFKEILQKHKIYFYNKFN